MYLKSTTEVSFNDTKKTTKTVLMTGKIEEIYMKVGSKETKIVYKFEDVDGVIYEHSYYILTDERRDELFPLVKDALPNIDEVGEAAYDLAMYYEGFKVEMAEEFEELTIEDIEIIKE
tara:strand:- start:397 stop:750 length:354 start_codon:yes stop_codon:yes gene_type:complete